MIDFTEENRRRERQDECERRIVAALENIRSDFHDVYLDCLVNALEFPFHHPRFKEMEWIAAILEMRAEDARDEAGREAA